MERSIEMETLARRLAAQIDNLQFEIAKSYSLVSSARMELNKLRDEMKQEQTGTEKQWKTLMGVI